MAGGATKRKKEVPKSRPAFVMKIWLMVNDPANHDYIRWNDDGQTFQVFQREEFMRKILPKYFKHNNFASFVRQLNMYGWHKVQDISSGTMQMGVSNSDEIMQFENPNFKRDREDLLDNIVRNRSVQDQPAPSGPMSSADNLQIILNELENLKRNQLAITEDLRRVRKDNKMLWQDNYVTRERHQQQAQTLEKILKFLAAVYGNLAGKILDQEPPKDVPPMLPGAFYAPRRRLMLTNGGDGYFARRSPHQSPHGTNQMNNPNNNNHLNGTQSRGQANPNQINNPQVNGQNVNNTPSNTNTTQNSARHNSNSTQNSVNGVQNPTNEFQAPSTESFSRQGSGAEPTPGDTESIEEIIRSIGNTPNGDRGRRMYQQIVQEPVALPRHFFPELNSPGYAGTPSQPLRLGTPEPTADLTALEQNVQRQGQSIQQVQDWIQRLAQQQQQNEGELDEFDMSEFLDKLPEEEGDAKRQRTY